MVRTIITPKQKSISLELPAEYVGKEVEVIAFTKAESGGLQETAVKNISFSALSIDTLKFRFNREEANER